MEKPQRMAFFQALAAQEVAHRAEEGLTGEDGEDEAEDGEGRNRR